MHISQLMYKSFFRLLKNLKGLFYLNYFKYFIFSFCLDISVTWVKWEIKWDSIWPLLPQKPGNYSLWMVTSGRSGDGKVGWENDRVSGVLLCQGSFFPIPLGPPAWTKAFFWGFFQGMLQHLFSAYIETTSAVLLEPRYDSWFFESHVKIILKIFLVLLWADI